MNCDEALRLIHTEIAIYDCSLLPTVKFGTDQVLGVRNGQYITIQRIRGFRLRTCNHIVTRHSELAGICDYCYAIAQEQGLPNAEYIALVCSFGLGRSRCFRRCNAAFCGCGLCPRHSGLQVETRQWFCLPHFDEEDKELYLQEVERKHGKLASGTVGSFKSLFFDDKGKLE